MRQRFSLLFTLCLNLLWLRAHRIFCWRLLRTLHAVHIDHFFELAHVFSMQVEIFIQLRFLKALLALNFQRLLLLLRVLVPTLSLLQLVIAEFVLLPRVVTLEFELAVSLFLTFLSVIRRLYQRVDSAKLDL